MSDQACMCVVKTLMQLQVGTYWYAAVAVGSRLGRKLCSCPRPCGAHCKLWTTR